MPLPPTAEARIFYQAAQQRFQDAEFLVDGRRTTAAVYMAGYSVECMLKALILSVTARRERMEIIASFRGGRAHDFAWLRAQYAERGGSAFPRHVALQFILVNTWSTSLRYKPGTLKERDARAFMTAATAILDWANGRL